MNEPLKITDIESFILFTILTFMSGFENLVSRRVNDVYGISTISHATRLKLGITNTEYIVADFILYCNSKTRPITYEYIYRKIGASKEQFNATVRILIDKGLTEFVHNEKGSHLRVTRKWLDAFMIAEEWFEAFWLVNNKAFWPGSKKDALKKFKEACKLYTPEFLIKCRDSYIRFLSHPANSWRKVMGAPVFLGLDKERFKEDWIAQLKRIENPTRNIASVYQEPITTNGKDILFQ